MTTITIQAPIRQLTPAQLAFAARTSDSGIHPWDESPAVRLVEDASGQCVLGASDVIDGGDSVGIHLEIPLEAFEDLGLDMCAEDDILQLTGTREEIASAAALFAAMASKLQAFLALDRV